MVAINETLRRVRGFLTEGKKVALVPESREAQHVKGSGGKERRRRKHHRYGEDERKAYQLKGRGGYRKNITVHEERKQEGGKEVP